MSARYVLRRPAANSCSPRWRGSAPFHKTCGYMRIELRERQHSLGATPVDETHSLDEGMAMAGQIGVSRGRMSGPNPPMSVHRTHLRLSTQRLNTAINVWPAMIRRYILLGGLPQGSRGIVRPGTRHPTNDRGSLWAKGNTAWLSIAPEEPCAAGGGVIDGLTAYRKRLDDPAGCHIKGTSG